jgi:Immunoglobulin domain
MKTLFFLLLACVAFSDTIVTGVIGSRLELSVTVGAGTPPFTYQWQKNGVNIIGATTATYAIQPMTAADFAEYTCVVTNSAGSTVSDKGVARLLVVPSSVTVRPVILAPAGVVNSGAKL